MGEKLFLLMHNMPKIRTIKLMTQSTVIKNC